MICSSCQLVMPCSVAKSSSVCTICSATSAFLIGARPVPNLCTDSLAFASILCPCPQPLCPWRVLSEEGKTNRGGHQVKDEQPPSKLSFPFPFAPRNGQAAAQNGQKKKSGEAAVQQAKASGAEVPEAVEARRRVEQAPKKVRRMGRRCRSGD